MNTKNIKNRALISVAGSLACLVLCLVSLFSGSYSAQAAINEQINYQGRLLTQAGAVVNDGDYNMRFKIYEGGNGCVGGGSSPCSGTLVWTEEWKQSNRVRVSNGYFSVYLGSLSAFGSSVDWNNGTLWLSIDIGGTANTSSPTYDGEMLPFRRFGAVPYAFNSGMLNGLQSTAFVQLAQGVQTDVSTTNASIFINKTGGTADIINLQRSGTSVFLINNGGSTSFKTTTDSTTGFQVSDADGGTPILNVDTDNERVGILTSTPTAALQVKGQTVLGDGVPVFDSLAPGVVALSIVNNGGPAVMGFDSFSSSASGGGAFFGVRGRGTQGSPSASLDGDLLFQLGASGTTTSGTPAALLGGASAINFLQDADATSSTAPAAITFNTQNSEIMRITSGGNVGIGDTSPANLFTVGTSDAFQINSSGQVIAGTWNGTDIAVADGGTGSGTQQGAINNLSGLTTNGDILYHNGTNSTRLARGSDGQCLQSTSSSIQWAGCPNISGWTDSGTDVYLTTSTDKVGIGTNSPAGALQVDGVTYLNNTDSSNSRVALQLATATTSSSGLPAYGIGMAGTSSAGFVEYRSGTSNAFNYGHRFLVNDSTVLEMLGNGNVGIGATTVLSKLHVSSATGSLFRVTDTTSTAQDVMHIADGGATTFKNQTNSTTALQVQPSGSTTPVLDIDTTNSRVGVGTNAPSNPLHVVGAIRQTSAVSCGISASATGVLQCTSDETLKDLKGEYKSGLDELQAINPIKFNYKGEDYTHVGFSAQNVQKVLPEATPQQGDGHLGLDPNAITALLVNSVKELDKKVEQQGSGGQSGGGSNDDLRAQVKALSEKVDKLASAGHEVLAATTTTEPAKAPNKALFAVGAVAMLCLTGLALKAQRRYFLR